MAKEVRRYTLSDELHAELSDLIKKKPGGGAEEVFRDLLDKAAERPPEAEPAWLKTFSLRLEMLTAMVAELGKMVRQRPAGLAIPEAPLQLPKNAEAIRLEEARKREEAKRAEADQSARAVGRDNIDYDAEFSQLNT